MLNGALIFFVLCGLLLVLLLVFAIYGGIRAAGRRKRERQNFHHVYGASVDKDTCGESGGS